MTARREQVQHFHRYQRQFARARRHRDRIAFRSQLEGLLQRIEGPSSVVAPQPTPPPAAAPEPTDRSAFDQAMRDLLVRVHALPGSVPDDAAGSDEPWWSPTPVIGFRVWHLSGGAWHGAKMQWSAPVKTAVCLHRWTDDGPVPHDALECGSPPCGIYALKSPDMLCAAERGSVGYSRGTKGIAAVALTGRVVEHEQGYRAEHVTVVAMAVIKGDHRKARFSWFDSSDDIDLLFQTPEIALSRGDGEVFPTPQGLAEIRDRLTAWLPAV